MQMHANMRLTGALALAASLSVAVPAQGKPFRFAFQGDVASMDPYALAENFSSAFHNNIHEPLVRYNSKMELEPALATSWNMVDANTWRFTLRKGVKFHDGSDFDADDVVFSLARAKGEGSDMEIYVGTIAEARKVDSHTVDLITKTPNPILLNTIALWYMMDKEWAEKNGASKPVNLAKNVENHATLNANGTGPFRLESREPGVRTVLALNDGWWNRDNQDFDVTEVVLTPIASDATRTAALLSGELDLMFPAPIQDVKRINASGVARVLQAPELRTIFLGMDQARDELLYSSVEGKNPFKDQRVRQAFYQAIDEEAIVQKIMRGAATPAGLLVAPGINGFDAKLNDRLPYDLDKAKALLAEAGYPEGFEVQLDCPNDRYVNDEQICQAVVGMLSRVGVKVNLLAQTKSKFFAKLKEHDVSFYLLGWIPDDQDAGSVIAHLMVPPSEGGLVWNGGRYGNARITELSGLIPVEVDPVKRQAMISEAFEIMKDDVGYIPLHQQALSWGVRSGVEVVQRPDNALHYWYIKIE